MEPSNFDKLLSSVREMDKIAKGKKKVSRQSHFPEPEVKAIRERLGISQQKFALILGVSQRTVENWEQGRRHPTGAARSLLRIVEADPELALQALSA